MNGGGRRNGDSRNSTNKNGSGSFRSSARRDRVKEALRAYKYGDTMGASEVAGAGIGRNYAPINTMRLAAEPVIAA